MADLLGEITGTLKKATDIIDERQKTLVGEIKTESTALMDKAAESSEVIMKKIDTHIESLKQTAEKPEESIEQLESFLGTLKDDIQNLSAVVDRRAKELQLAVKKNTELLLEEIEDDFRRVQEFTLSGISSASKEGDKEKRTAIIDGVIGKLDDFSNELRKRAEDLKESGEEVTKKAVDDASKQVDMLKSKMTELRENFPVDLKVIAPAPSEGDDGQAKKVKKVMKKK